MTKFRCSGSRFTKPIPAETCLGCALKHENDCGYSYPLLQSMLQSEFREGIHVTDLTGCLLRSYWRKTDPEPEYIHETLLRFIGIVAHNFLEEENEYFEAELPLEAAGIVGRADVVFKDGRILDFKATRWIKPDKLPYGSHETQVNIYAQLLRELGREVKSAAIQYIDMSGPTKCRSCRVPVRKTNGVYQCPLCGGTPSGAHGGAVLKEIPLWPQREVETFIQERRDSLASALAMQIPPQAEPGYLCRYCSFLERCPEGQKGTK